MAARFILSFDCEGKWGVADHLTSALHRHLSDASLRQAYRDILALLDTYHVCATFAFVGCFSLSAQRLAAIRSELLALAQFFPDYLGKMLDDYDAGSREGWIGDWALDAVAASPCAHEIGLHGVTHVPWNHPAMTEALARQELGLAYDEHFPVAANTRTYIYPRNAVAYPQLLAERGIVGYREARPRGSRFVSLLSELNLFAKSDHDPDKETLPLPIPAGRFVNWQSGARKYVPIQITQLRARMMLRHAVATNGIVHYWMHPENVATAPATLGILQAILQEVVALRERGLCDVVTQNSYCRQLRGNH